VSYENAWSGITRHATDITYTRNWLVTGLVVYYGALISAGKLSSVLNIPPLAVTLLALAFTMYERGNGELLRKYCLEVESGNTSLPIETWLKEWNKGKGCLGKLSYYVSVFWPKWTYWLWMVLLTFVIAAMALGRSP
jgi:hypothetical protein